MKLALNLIGGALVALLALPFAVAFLTNSYYLTVAGRSMVPTYQPGDILLVSRDVSAADIQKGDIVVIDPNDAVSHYSDSKLRLGPYVHRIVDITSDHRYVTRGDGNNNDDPASVSTSMIAGRPLEVRLSGLAATAFTVAQEWAVRIPLLVLAACAFIFATMLGGRPKIPSSRAPWRSLKVRFDRTPVPAVNAADPQE